MTELTRAEVVLGANDRRLRSALGRAQSITKSAGRRMGRIVRRAAQVITAALAAAGVAAVKFAGDFEQSMTRLETLVGLGREQVQGMGADLKRIAVETGRPLTQLSEAMFAITSGGLRGADAMEALAQSAKAGAIGLGDLQSIGRTASAALAAFGDQGLTATEAIDQMVATVRAGNLRAEELAGSLGRVMGIASTLGVRFADMNAFIATFTRLGASAEESATSLRAILQGLTGANQQATKAFEELEIPIDKVRQTIREQGLVEGLRQIVEATDGNIEALTEVIPNIRALAGFLGVAGAQSEDFARIQADVRDALGVTNEGFARASENLNLMMSRLREMGRVALVSIGEQLMPLIKDLADSAIQNLPGVFSGIAQAVGRIGLVVVRIAEAIQTDAGQAFLNLGIVLGARLGQGIFTGLEAVLRETFVLAKIPGPVGEVFDRLNLAAAGAGAVADIAKDSAEKAQEALQILSEGSDFGKIRALLEELEELEVSFGGTGGGTEAEAEQPQVPSFGGVEVSGQFQNLVQPAMEQVEVAQARLEQVMGRLGKSGGEAMTSSLGDELKRGARFAMQSLLEGLVRGRDNILDSIVSIGLSIGSQLLSGGLFSALGIGSPAKAGIFAGEMLGEGVRIGVKRSLDSVRRAGAGLGAAAVGAMGAGGMALSASAGGRASSIRSGTGVIDASRLGPMGQMGVRFLMQEPTMQRFFTAGVDDAGRRGGR